MSRKVEIAKFKMLYFEHERRDRTGNLPKDLFLGRLQPGVDKNSEDLTIIILEFVDVTVKLYLYTRFMIHQAKNNYHKYTNYNRE